MRRKCKYSIIKYHTLKGYGWLREPIYEGSRYAPIATGISFKEARVMVKLLNSNMREES